MEIKKYTGIVDFEGIDVSKLIILAGAGVSLASPTKLPSGKELTEYYLSMCLGHGMAREILQQWKKLNDIIYKANGIGISLIRLEFIVGCINDVDKEFNYFPLLAGFQRFSNVNPNVNHYYLAGLKKSGCEIITPNFDCAIEKIFDYYIPAIRLGVPSNEVEGGVIYHYHGIGSKYEQLGVTIAEMKKGVKKEFGEQLIQWFQQGYSIICVGFSCSDYFDITPFFESLPKNTYEGKAIFFQHGDVVEKEVQSKIEPFWGAFCNKKILYGNTTEFLNDLNFYFGCDKSDYCVEDVIEWKTEFEHIMKNHKRESLFYFLKVLNQSGILLSKTIFNNLHTPELIRDFLCMEDILEYVIKELNGIDVKSHIESMDDRSKSVFSDIIDLCRKISYSSEGVRRIENDFHIVTQNSGVRKDEKQISYEDLVSHISESSLIPENFVTIYVYAFNRISKDRICYILSQRTITTDDEKIQCLYECAVKMLKLKYCEYEYISYYISIAKIYNILCIMLNKENNIQESENYLLNLALEICGLSLVAKIYFNSVLQYIMLFFKEENWYYWEKASEKMLVIKEYIEIIGSKELEMIWEKNNEVMKEMEGIYKNGGKDDMALLTRLIN